MPFITSSMISRDRTKHPRLLSMMSSLNWITLTTSLVELSCKRIRECRNSLSSTRVAAICTVFINLVKPKLRNTFWSNCPKALGSVTFRFCLILKRPYSSKQQDRKVTEPNPAISTLLTRTNYLELPESTRSSANSSFSGQLIDDLTS